MADHPIKARITEAMKDAMRAKEKERLGAIRLILTEFKKIEVDERQDVTDERAISVLDKMVKLTEALGEQMAKGAELDALIRKKLGGLGYEF